MRERPTSSLKPGYPDPAKFVDQEVVFRDFCCPGVGGAAGDGSGVSGRRAVPRAAAGLSDAAPGSEGLALAAAVAVMGCAGLECSRGPGATE